MSLQPGTFQMKATGPAELTKSPEKGTEGVRVVCSYLDGPNAGLSIEWIGWLSEKAIAKTNESLTNMGFDGEDLSTVQKNTFSGVTESEVFDKADGSKGERPRLRWINGGSRMLAMSAPEAMGAKERLKAAFFAAKSGKSASSPAAEDDVKF